VRERTGIFFSTLARAAIALGVRSFLFLFSRTCDSQEVVTSTSMSFLVHGRSNPIFTFHIFATVSHSSIWSACPGTAVSIMHGWCLVFFSAIYSLACASLWRYTLALASFQCSHDDSRFAVRCTHLYTFILVHDDPLTKVFEHSFSPMKQHFI
jgi:hypothetical protein